MISCQFAHPSNTIDTAFNQLNDPCRCQQIANQEYLIYWIACQSHALSRIDHRWLSLILGAVLCLYGLSHSAIPSYSTRITAVGKIYDYAEREGYRGDAAYGFRFVPKGTESINIHTRILLPDRGLGGGAYRVVYLQDDTRRLKHEAVDIAILSGKGTGFHASLDAAPFGSG